jgi:hypothetical protein
MRIAYGEVPARAQRAPAAAPFPNRCRDDTPRVGATSRTGVHNDRKPRREALPKIGVVLGHDNLSRRMVNCKPKLRLVRVDDHHVRLERENSRVCSRLHGA